MPGLLRGMARTAAVVGTAQATRNAVNRRSAKKDAAAYEEAITEAQNAQTTDPTVEIKKYKGMLDEGLITQEEFDAKKKQILGI